MKEVRILEIKQSVFADNDRQAQELREELKEKGVFLLNLMSSPGAGKTTTLMRTIEGLKDTFKIGVMEADIDSDVDARTISQSGAKVIQLHTGGMCHLDAGMTRQGLEGTREIPYEDGKTVFTAFYCAPFEEAREGGTKRAVYCGRINRGQLPEWFQKLEQEDFRYRWTDGDSIYFYIDSPAKIDYSEKRP